MTSNRNGAVHFSEDSEKGAICSKLWAPGEVSRIAEKNHFMSEAFHVPAYRRIWDAIDTLPNQEERADFVLLKNELGDEIDDCGGAEALNDLYDFVPTHLNAEHYLKIVQEKHAARLALVEARDMVRNLEAGQVPTKAQLVHTATRIGDVATGLNGVVISTPDQQPFPVLSGKALYGSIGEIVRAIAPETEAHPAAVLVQLLMGFANLIGSSPESVGGQNLHHANIFAVIVGQSSKSRKGTSWSPALSVLRQIDPDWAQNNLTGGLSSGEGLIHAVRDPSYEYDKKEKEKVLVDPGVEDKRLMVHESEFSQALSAMGRNNSILSAIIRQAWDTGNIKTMIKSSHAQATGAHISIAAHITREELMKQMATCEFFNGFANRFLWFVVKRMNILPRGGNFTLQSVALQIKALKEAVHQIRKAGEVTIERSPAAWDLWDKDYEPLSRARGGRAGVACDRGESQVLRLSMIYALTDGSFTINEEHHLAAMALWEYCLDSSKYIFGEEPANPNANKILDELDVTPPGLTVTEISSTIFRRNLSSSAIREALQELADADRAYSVTARSGGRPQERWFSKKLIRT